MPQCIACSRLPHNVTQEHSTRTQSMDSYMYKYITTSLSSCTHIQETDVIVNQVLDELGISLDHELGDITPGLEKPHIASSSAPVCVCVCAHCLTCVLLFYIASFPGSSPTFWPQKVGEKSKNKATSIRGTGCLFRCYYPLVLLPEKGGGSGRRY